MTDPFKEKYCRDEGTKPGHNNAHFPRSVCQAQWIGAPSEHEAHPGRSLVTHNHEVILDWAARRNAIPATIPGTEHDDHLGVLRFDFPDWGSNERLEHVTWEQWFDTFDERQLVMLYQEHLRNGHRSNFFHFNSPYREHM